MPSGDVPLRSPSHGFVPTNYAPADTGPQEIRIGFPSVIWRLVMASAGRLLGEAMGLCKPMGEQALGLAVMPLVIPYSMVTAISGTAVVAHRDTVAWVTRAQSKQQSSGAIGRALAHALTLVNDLPTSSNKYPFARAMAEKILADNASLDPPLLDVNRAALARGFRRTVHHLEAALRRERGSTRLGQLIERYAWSGLTDFGNNQADKAEKYARELLWMAEKMAECKGIDEACWQWSKASGLATMALAAGPRIQRSLVRLSAILCRAVGNGEVVVSREVRFRLLLLWMPLFCRATHGGDGPIFSSWEKQEIEEALQRAILPLPANDQELIFATWLEEYSWSSSDWPNFQKAYGHWCEKARLQAVAGPIALRSS